ncbi:MAG: chromosome segregation protein SMC [Candidatus Parabeggiatoa sp. nov. 3]|nr:MAG: chromosome segregation protein SMC [Gammaproteobacteria bacterium]RKZ69667.1 MAG: chromosome segregation protein SMC [Gammaproteobacteria bacterium]RKZ88082.1 MAG: chromosome segregation protein SMC [Gammaproteobacteria bacterium]
MIKEICIENYKSIQSRDAMHRVSTLELGRVTVLIGENGCGKSNILEAIALSAAAAADKLDNEFLAPRGIRATEPHLMRAAFDKDNVTQEIKISLKGDNDLSFVYRLQNSNHPYSNWTNEISFKTREREAYLSLILEKLRENPPSKEDNAEIMSQKIKEAAESLNNEPEYIKVKASSFAKNNKYLSHFIIYSPEYHCLRNFKEEGQIQPLGINGEGLFKLLQVLSLNKDKLNEIKEKLKLIGWFKDFKVPNNLFIGERAIQIEDRYLDQDISFEQKSTNEGFLFLLFYFCLFISEETPPFFAIDNIDASLNPLVCRRLIKELVNLAKKYDKQVIFTTHNPAILDGLNLNDEEQRLFIVSRNRSGYTKAKRFRKPETPEGEEPITLSEAFLRGYIGGLPKSF